MYSQLAIVVGIDVEAARAAKSLRGHAYLVDNNRFMGSTGQGTENLVTVVEGTQIVNWLATGLDFSGTQPFPVLESITGEAVDKQIMVPQLFDSPGLDGNLGLWWGATVDANVAGKYSYTLNLDVGGLKLPLVATLDVRTGFTMETPLPTPPRALALRRTQALLARVMADGSLLNPDNHVSLFAGNERRAIRAAIERPKR